VPEREPRSTGSDVDLEVRSPQGRAAGITGVLTALNREQMQVTRTALTLTALTQQGGFADERGCASASFPQANLLVPLGSTAEGSTPTSKPVGVRLEPTTHVGPASVR
jgi:hypothetical protein